MSVGVLLEQSEKGLLLSNGKCTINMCTNKINSDSCSSEQKYVHFSNRTMKFVTCLQYEYTQIAVDLFCENVSLVHWVVCLHISPFFLYLKNVLQFYNLDPQCRVAWQER